MLTLIDRFRMFARAASVDDRIGSTEIAVYTMLLSIDNDLLFQEWFGCSDRRLQDMTQVGSVHTITKAKNRLKQLGWVDFKASGKKTTLYKLTVPDCATECATEILPTATECATECATDTATECATDTATDTAALRRQDKTARQDKTKKKIQKEKPLDVLIADYTQDSELLDALRGFVEMRKEKKAPLTEHALSLLLKKLDGLGHSDAEKAEIVNQSVMNSWKGFFALKQEVRQHGAGRNDSREALEERYSDFVEADRNHVYPWEIQPDSGGDRAASGGNRGN